MQRPRHRRSGDRPASQFGGITCFFAEFAANDIELLWVLGSDVPAFDWGPIPAFVTGSSVPLEPGKFVHGPSVLEVVERTASDLLADER